MSAPAGRPVSNRDYVKMKNPRSSLPLWTTGWLKTFVLGLAASLLLVDGAMAQGDEENIQTDQVMAIVGLAADEMAKDAPAVLAKILASQAPFVNPDNPALYVFVYDTDVNMLAHPNASLVGRNYKGKPDVKGKNFRDEIVEGAKANGTGWVDYAYQKPGAPGIFDKTAYYRLVKGSDGKEYVVVSGKYKDK